SLSVRSARYEFVALGRRDRLHQQNPVIGIRRPEFLPKIGWHDLHRLTEIAGARIEPAACERPWNGGKINRRRATVGKICDIDFSWIGECDGIARHAGEWLHSPERQHCEEVVECAELRSGA